MTNVLIAVLGAAALVYLLFGYHMQAVVIEKKFNFPFHFVIENILRVVILLFWPLFAIPLLVAGAILNIMYLIRIVVNSILGGLFENDSKTVSVRDIK